VDYQKLDSALAAALEESPQETHLSIFIQLDGPPSALTLDNLHRIGVSGNSSLTIFTARLHPQAIAVLSDQPFVRFLKLAQPLRSLQNEIP
jgi:hypothetical protein